MDRLESGFAVFGVDDRRLGQVSGVNSCCFVVSRSHALAISLVPGSIFNVDRRRVTLVCSNEDVGRYLCPNHTSPAG